MRNIVILLALLLTGCDLFRLRDSEPPAKPAPWNDYATNWDLCLENLEYCFEDGRNAVKYAGLFAEDFSFSFATQDVNDFGLSPVWNTAQEQDMLLNLHSQTDSIAITLNTLESQPDEISSDQARIYRSYELLRHPPGGTEPVLYRGNLEILFKKSGGYWYISKWYDYRAYSNPTWGKLKYDFSV